MIQINRLTQPLEFEEALKNIYHYSFPSDERREWDNLMKLTHHQNFNLHSILHNNVPIGLITLWKLPEFIFIEHFAIDKTFRGKGIGSEVLNELKKEVSAKIILETEEPDTKPAMRRINFYKRLGFHLCQEDYYQPAYSKDKEAVKMLLMSYPEMITQSAFITIKARLYEQVYQLNNSEFPSI